MRTGEQGDLALAVLVGRELGPCDGRVAVADVHREAALCVPLGGGRALRGGLSGVEVCGHGWRGESSGNLREGARGAGARGRRARAERKRWRRSPRRSSRSRAGEDASLSLLTPTQASPRHPAKPTPPFSAPPARRVWSRAPLPLISHGTTKDGSGCEERAKCEAHEGRALPRPRDRAQLDDLPPSRSLDLLWLGPTCRSVVAKHLFSSRTLGCSTRDCPTRQARPAAPPSVLHDPALRTLARPPMMPLRSGAIKQGRQHCCSRSRDPSQVQARRPSPVEESNSAAETRGRALLCCPSWKTVCEQGCDTECVCPVQVARDRQAHGVC